MFGLLKPWNFLSDGVRGAFSLVHNKFPSVIPEIMLVRLGD